MGVVHDNGEPADDVGVIGGQQCQNGSVITAGTRSQSWEPRPAKRVISFARTVLTIISIAPFAHTLSSSSGVKCDGMEGMRLHCNVS